MNCELYNEYHKVLVETEIFNNQKFFVIENKDSKIVLLCEDGVS